MNDEEREIAGKTHRIVAVKLKGEIGSIMNLENILDTHGMDYEFIGNARYAPFNGLYLLFDICAREDELNDVIEKWSEGKYQMVFEVVPSFGSEVVFLE